MRGRRVASEHSTFKEASSCPVGGHCPVHGGTSAPACAGQQSACSVYIVQTLTKARSRIPVGCRACAAQPVVGALCQPSHAPLQAM